MLFSEKVHNMRDARRNGVQAVLFDLDGTLLPMNQDVFVKRYLQELGAKGAGLGYGGQDLVRMILQGFEVMVANDGKMTNEERFWELFMATYGGERKKHTAVFEEFYHNEFARVAEGVNPTPLSNEAVQVLKEKGYEIVLATNPVFPRVATVERMGWAGLNPEDFTLITTYENSAFAKPNLDYYREILRNIGARAEECLMVGNDVQEDISASRLGMHVFLVTDDLINAAGEDYSEVPQGDRQAMVDYLKALPIRG